MKSRAACRIMPWDRSLHSRSHAIEILYNFQKMMMFKRIFFATKIKERMFINALGLQELVLCASRSDIAANVLAGH